MDEDTDYDYSDEMSYDADADSAVAEALRTVNVNPVSARRTLLEAYGDDAKAAVYALYAEGNRISKEGGEFATERLAQVEKLRNSVLANSERLSEKGTKRLAKAFRQYGVENVVVDSKLVTDAGNTLTNAISSLNGTMYSGSSFSSLLTHNETTISSFRRVLSHSTNISKQVSVFKIKLYK